MLSSTTSRRAEDDSRPRVVEHRIPGFVVTGREVDCSGLVGHRPDRHPRRRDRGVAAAAGQERQVHGDRQIDWGPGTVVANGRVGHLAQLAAGGGNDAATTHLADLTPHLFPKHIVDLDPCPDDRPPAEVVEPRAVGCKIMRKRTPRASVPYLVKDRVDESFARCPPGIGSGTN